MAEISPQRSTTGGHQPTGQHDSVIKLTGICIDVYNSISVEQKIPGSCISFEQKQILPKLKLFLHIITIWWFRNDVLFLLLGCQLYNSPGIGCQVWENFDYTGSGWSRADPVSIAAWWPRISRSGGKVHALV